MKLNSWPVWIRFIWWCFQYFQFSLKCVWRLAANRVMAQHFSEFRHNEDFALILKCHSEFGKNGEPYFEDLSTLLGWVSSWFRAYNRLPDVSRSVFVQPLTSLNSCPVRKRFCKPVRDQLEDLSCFIRTYLHLSNFCSQPIGVLTTLLSVLFCWHQKQADWYRNI